MYRLTFVALAFFVFLPASTAHAQLDEIIHDFCISAATVTDDFLGDFGRAANELQDCFDDFGDCQGIGVDVGESNCLGNFRRCTERADRKAERACSDFQKDFRGAFDVALASAVQAGVGDDFLNSPIVQEKVGVAQKFGGLCGSPPDEPPALDPDNVCETALCSDNGSPVRAEECSSAVEECRGYPGEDLETCVSLGLFICRGAVLAEDPPAAPEDPPTEEPNVCNQGLCALSEVQAQTCREFFFSCLNSTVVIDQCLGASLLFCQGGF